MVVHENSKQVVLEHPGSRVSIGPLLLQQENGPGSLTIHVKKTGNGFVTLSDVKHLTTNLLLGVVNQKRNKLQYYNIDQIQNNIIYILYRVDDLMEVNSVLPIYLYTIPFEKIFPNLVVPMVPYNNLVCVEAKLISLTLPNLPV